MGVRGRATEACKQKSAGVTFVLGKSTGGNVQGRLHGGWGGGSELRRLIVRGKNLVSFPFFASLGRNPLPEKKNFGY